MVDGCWTGTAVDECWIGALAGGAAAERWIGAAVSGGWIGLPVGIANGTGSIPDTRIGALTGESAADARIGALTGEAAADARIGALAGNAAADRWIGAAVSEDWTGSPVCVAGVDGPVLDGRAGSLVGMTGAAGPASGRIESPTGKTDVEPAFWAAAGELVEGVTIGSAVGAERAADER